MCLKHACVAHGSRDYARHQEAANKALPYPFASAKHFHANNAEGEALNKSMQISSPNIRNRYGLLSIHHVSGGTFEERTDEHLSRVSEESYGFQYAFWLMPHPPKCPGPFP